MGPHVESEAEVLEPHDLNAPISKRLALSIVTPTGSILAKDVDELIAPGVEGEFGVLPGHVAFLSALKPGVLSVRDGRDREVLAVAAGFLQVGVGGQVRVLVDRALRPNQIKADEVRAEKGKVEEQLRAIAHQAPAPVDHGAGAPPPSGARELQARLDWANAQLAALAATGVVPSAPTHP